jgi:hypothetical protein
LAAFVVVSDFDESRSDWGRWKLHVLLSCISFMTKDVVLSFCIFWLFGLLLRTFCSVNLPVYSVGCWFFVGSTCFLRSIHVAAFKSGLLALHFIWQFIDSVDRVWSNGSPGWQTPRFAHFCFSQQFWVKLCTFDGFQVNLTVAFIYISWLLVR